ncbi:hypothetical protein BHY_1025 (plasmid) [Borrelia nietonii YOR]|uniref:Uncharacterized protein n=1 Tax=Borrelia nietonii YOR TaxID=1293576 RepID=W5SFS7_9SPIR|nr:hypothetical protein BHY_1025 [Borrelia nietonii YOR]
MQLQFGVLVSGKGIFNLFLSARKPEWGRYE